MKWLTEPLIVDPALAAVLARDLRRVAEADGHVHDRELALIATFAAEIPEGSAADHARLASPRLQGTYVRSLVLLALADGELSEVEFDLIKEMAAEHGVEPEDVDRVAAALQMTFFGSPLAGKALRDALRASAREQGLDADGAGALWN